MTVEALKKNEEVVETLGERILGRVSLHDIYNPLNQEIVINAGEEITEDIVKIIETLPIDKVEVRSPLTCEAKKGICAKCYGRNLATGKMVQIGEAVGVIAAQSIGEPGTQLTLRTFHVGGIAGNISEENKLVSKFDGITEIEDLKTVKTKDNEGNDIDLVLSRTCEIKVLDADSGIVLSSNVIPYGSSIFVKNNKKIKKDDVICSWDPYNGVIISEFGGKVEYENIEQGITYQVEIDEQTGFKQKVISESRNKKLIPTLLINDSKGKNVRTYNLPVGAQIIVDDGEKVEQGKILVKIPRKSAKSGDITGGLPRVTELFEARNPSNPAIVSEIDGVVSFGKIKRGNREIIIESKTGEIKKYLVKLSNQILVQENDFVKAGMSLSDGAMTPNDILNIKGPSAVQQYLVNEVQEVYRLQGVKINDKHFEVLIRQMMQKNLTCKSLAEAKKNMVVFSFILVLVTLVFLVLGSLLFIYSSQTGVSIPFLNGSENTDLLFPEIALNSDLGLTMGIVFLLGLIAAAYSSADSALTSLTTSFCVDFLDISKKDDKTQKNIRIKTHIAMSLILAIVIILYKNLLNTNVIDGLLTVAGYTYGPLLGLFAFGIFTKYKINDKLSLAVCIISVIIVMFIGRIPSEYIGGYVIGYELLPLNGLITFIGLFLIRKSPSN